MLISEEESGSEQSLSVAARVRLQKRVKELDLARLLVQKQQGRWMRRRVLSGTSSSLSSGDDDRRNTTGSEDDHTSEESKRSLRLRTTEEQESREGRSRIPRPVTPIRRPLAGLSAAANSLVSSPETSGTKATSGYEWLSSCIVLI